MNRRLALVVANDSYRDEGLTSLFAPVQDAQTLRELLRDPEIGGFDPAEILVNESKAEIERAIERLFLGAEPGDLVTLYFSGHGVRSRGGRLHLAVGNTELKLLSSTSISASFVTDLIEESDASSTVVLLDCCYSGAFADGLKSDPQIDVGRELRAGRGTYVLTAANSVETADDGRPAAGGRPRTLSAFTEAVVRGLSTGAADVRGVGRISPNDLWEYVRQEVPSRTTRQTPTQYGYVEDEVHLANVRRAYPTATETGGLRVHLGDLLGPLTQTAEHGLRAEEWRGTGRLVVPIGQVFRGTERAEPVWLDLAHTDGHLLVVGRIGSGKSTLLRTLIGALALTHTPDEVRFYCLESGGNKLGSLRRLPSFAQLAGDDQDEAGVVGDLLAEIQAVIDRRKQLFRQYEVDSATRFRVIRDNLPDGPHPDLFLLIDRWSEFAGHADRIRGIAASGLEYGVHVVVAARGWRDIPDDLEELIHARIELGLGRASESHVDARLAEQIPVDRPGWALLRRTRFRIALPELRTAIGPGATEGWDGAEGTAAVWASEASDGALDLVDRVAKAWSRMHEARPDPRSSHPATRATPPLSASPSVLDLLGVTDLSPVVPRHGDNARLRVPIGVDRAGEPVMLDLKQAAEGGVGPHGLLVGATGAGKSELLRTLVTALALTHDPTQLNVVFADFKGGAAYAPFARLPHTAGMVTNLAEDLTLVDRLADTIAGELIRRQELLRQAGNYSSARDYEAARALGARLEPLPALLVICDEFVELISAAPQMIELFVQIGRTGRSLGVHLLLASQRLDEGRLRGLDTHLSYRIALRTFSAAESNAVLGIPDAYELPRSPGHGYLKTDAGPPVRFLAATSFEVPPSLPPGAEALPAAELVARTLHDAHPPAPQIWLPPLTEVPALDALLGPVVIDPERGLTVDDVRLRGARRVPVGLVDKPYQQRQDPLWLALQPAAGHVAVVGAPRTGKSSLLRTLVCALALTHTPDEVQVYCLDFGGGTLDVLRDLPHVGGVAGRTEPDAVRRTIGDLLALLNEREPAPSGFSGVFLAVDGWYTLRADFEDLDPAVRQILSVGPRCGIQVIASASRWGEFGVVNETLFGTRLELRLTDPAESVVGRKAAARVPLDRPGRGVTMDGDQFIAAAPDVSTLHGGTPALVRAAARAWPGPPAPRVRLLPTELPYTDLDLTADAGNPLAIPVGVSEADLRQVAVDFAADPHFLLFGDTECGKSTFLRVLAAGIANRLTPEQARVVAVDHRRSLLGGVPEEHLLGYGSSASTTAKLIEELADAMQRRLPGPDVTPQQLRDRSWWTGPECFVLVDDYDLVTAGQSNPLAPLLEYLPQARDIGLHLVLARRSGGAGRALFEPVIQRLRDLSSAGMVMSGNRDEGVLLGDARPRPLPPGRGWLVTRKSGTRLIQVAHLPPPP